MRGKRQINMLNIIDDFSNTYNFSVNRRSKEIGSFSAPNLLKIIKIKNFALCLGTALNISYFKENTNQLFFLFKTLEKKSNDKYIFLEKLGKFSIAFHDIYLGFVWIQREIYDMFGIRFKKNKENIDLRRILTDYAFKGHPLKKIYSFVGYKEKTYNVPERYISRQGNAGVQFIYPLFGF